MPFLLNSVRRRAAGSPPPVGPPVVEIIIDPDNAAGTDYTSLQAALVAEAKDIAASDEQYLFRCRSSAGTADNSGDNEVQFNSWTTDQANGNVIRIEPYDASQRAGTEWDASKYRFVLNSTTSWHRIFINNKAVIFDGIQVEKNGASEGNLFFCNHNGANVPTDFLQVFNCYLKYTSGGDTAFALQGGGNNGGFRVVNNVIEGAWGYVFGFWYTAVIFHCEVYNNTIIGAAWGFRIGESAANLADLKIRNNLIDSSAAEDWVSDGNIPAANHSGNSTSDGTSPDGLANQSNSFTSATDYQITTSDDAYQSGVNLSADPDYAFATDMLGRARPASWSVGATEAV